MSLREAADELLGAFARNDLLTYGSAIAFQVFFALIPLLLFAFGLVGAFGLDELWSKDIAPDLQKSVSAPAFTLMNDTALKVLGKQQLFWTTIGLVVAVWEMSGATRAVMGVFDRIYCSERKRSAKERYLTSIWLAVVSGALFLAAVAVFMGGPLLGTAMTIARWPLCILLLFGVVAMLVRMAPADRQPAEWVSFGSMLVVVAWLGTSVAFAFYVRNIADYGNIFGALATVIITFEYLYLAACAFLIGAQLDALIRERSEE